jgi:ribosomal protein L37E
MEFVLAVLVLVLALVVLAYPLYRAQTQPALATGATLDDLLAERDGVYATLRDLELDRQLGKLDESDYAALQDKYMNRAAVILRELDTLRGEGGTKEASDEIEKQVAALRQVAPEEAHRQTKSTGRSASITSSVKPQAAELHCANCGRPYHTGDKFCARCGQALS